MDGVCKITYANAKQVGKVPVALAPTVAAKEAALVMADVWLQTDASANMATQELIVRSVSKTQPTKCARLRKTKPRLRFQAGLSEA